MRRAFTAALAALAIALTVALAGQSPPPDDFPIAQLQYKEGPRLFYLHSPYGFVARWENGQTIFFAYDKSGTNVTTTTDLRTFTKAISAFPDGAEVAWINTCGAPLHYGMPEETLKAIRQILTKKKFQLADSAENNFVLCTCEATNLSFFTKAPSAR